MVENREGAWKLKIIQPDNNIDISWFFHVVILYISSIKSFWVVNKQNDSGSCESSGGLAEMSPGSSPWPDSREVNSCEPGYNPLCLLEYLLTKPGHTVHAGWTSFCLPREKVLLMDGEILKEEESKGLGGARRENYLSLALSLSSISSRVINRKRFNTSLWWARGARLTPRLCGLLLIFGETLDVGQREG